MRGRRAVSWPLLLLVLLLLWEKEGSAAHRLEYPSQFRTDALLVHPLLSSCFVVSKRLE